MVTLIKGMARILEDQLRGLSPWICRGQVSRAIAEGRI